MITVPYVLSIYMGRFQGALFGSMRHHASLLDGLDDSLAR